MWLGRAHPPGSRSGCERCARARVAPTRPPRCAALCAAQLARHGRARGPDMRPVTHGDILAAARVLLSVPDAAWPATLQDLLDKAARADRQRQIAGALAAGSGNGTLMAAALARFPPVAPPVDTPRHLAALATVIAALLARSERLEGHCGQGSADAGNIEQLF